MRFKGFYEIKEWDGTHARVSVTEERCDLADFLKYRIQHWIHLHYGSGITHRVTPNYFKEICMGTIDPNIYHNGVPR